MIDNYANLIKDYRNLEKIEFFKMSTPIKINEDCLKGLTDKIFHNKTLQGVNFFNYGNMPLFKPDDLGNYFVPKLLYRGFQVLYLDMSGVSMGKFELEAVQDCIKDPQCNNFLKELGLKIRKTK